MTGRIWLQLGSVVAALSFQVCAHADDDYPPALLEHFMKARNLTDVNVAKKTVAVKARPDVDLDGKPDYLVQLRRSDKLCVYEVYRSGNSYAYSGQLACCKWSEQRAKDHLELTCQDPAGYDTVPGKVAWRAAPWSYGNELTTPNPAATGGLAAKGAAALKAGRYAEARELLGKALINGPETPQLHYQYALAVKGQGDLGVARGALREALKIDPAFEPALLAKADWYWDEGNKESAVRAYKKYLEVAKDPAGIERARKRAP
jgi:tetratricopeptide (TPR) repeat protein